VVADNQFAPLGLILIAILARISHFMKAVGDCAPVSDKPNIEDLKKVALSYDGDRGEAVSCARDAEVSTSSSKRLRKLTHARISEKRNSEQMPDFENLVHPEKITRLRRRRRRQKSNAIDEIFSPLL